MITGAKKIIQFYFKSNKTANFYWNSCDCDHQTNFCVFICFN